MKRIFAATILAALFVAVGVVSKPPLTKTTTTVHADAGGVCSLAAVAGNYDSPSPERSSFQRVECRPQLLAEPR